MSGANEYSGVRNSWLIFKLRRVSWRGNSRALGSGSKPKLPGGEGWGGTIFPLRTAGRGSACSGGTPGGVKPGGGAASVRNNGVGGLTAGLRLAPGSGLNCGGGTGGALELIETLRDQLVAGGALVGSTSLFGSGSNAAGDRGGGPGLMAWWGFKRFGSFVSAASADTASTRHLVMEPNQERMNGRARNGIAAMKRFPPP